MSPTDVTPDPRLDALATPALVVDEAKMRHNIDRLADHIDDLGGTLRPHLKTTKSLEIADIVLAGHRRKATVSTLAEAEAFANHGIDDLIYAVGIAPHKLDRVAAIRGDGCDLAVILDSTEQAREVVAASQRHRMAIPALIEIDSDGHRGGVSPTEDVLVEIASILAEGAELRGVLTHAGASYDEVGAEAHASFAERERYAVVSAAEALRTSGLPCPVVSMGSTPTAHAAESLDGVTEIRAGVYMFFDLVQAGIGVCAVDDIALSVLTTVIGHQRDRGWTVVDAGWMAMSRDRGTADQTVDQGYGIVCDAAGDVIDDMIVVSTSQEHGIIAPRAGSTSSGIDLPVGTLLRILPNHACATASQFTQYDVVPSDPAAPLMSWSRIAGW